MSAETTLGRWRQVHDLLGKGTALLECARRLDLSLNTVKRYARAERLERLQHAPQYRLTFAGSPRPCARRSPPPGRLILWALSWLFSWADPCGQHPGGPATLEPSRYISRPARGRNGRCGGRMIVFITPLSAHSRSRIRAVAVHRCAGSDVIRSHASQRQSNEGAGVEK